MPYSTYPADDRYFRFHFADTRRMAGLLCEFLPQEICRILDFATLRRLHDPGLWLQLLKSMVTYRYHTGFTAVIPVVVRTGPHPFRLETPMDWLSTEPSLATLQPTFSVWVIDLALCSLERIHHSTHLDAVAKISLGILKSSREATLLPGVRNLFNAMSPQLSRKRRLRILQQASL